MSSDLPAPSELETASPVFLRQMMAIGGRILDDLADDAAGDVTLRFICDSARELLDAARVEVVIPAGGGEPVVHQAAIAAHDHDAPASIELDIGRGTRVDAVLRVWWLEDDRPTEFDRVVVGRFSRMVLLVVDRTSARRDQLLAVTRERQLFAGEIHDDPIQLMTAASIELQLVARKVEPGQRDNVDHARATVESAIERLRHIMYSLHPPVLDEDGLVAAIEGYCETYIEPIGLPWRLKDRVGEAALPLEVAALAFRLTRGALVNVVKHAGATEVSITLEATEDRLNVEIRDDGDGFDPAILASTPVGHFGITHSVTLARWLGGTYVTESGPGEGTVVTLSLPLTATLEDQGAPDLPIIPPPIDEPLDQHQVTVVIVDDHEVVARGIGELLTSQRGIEVVGTAGSVAAGVALVERKAPDVVLVDYRLPDGTGADAASRIRALEPRPAVVMVTSVADRRALSQALDAGCSGFVSKSADRDELIAAVRAAAADDTYVTRDMLKHLVHLRRYEQTDQEELSEREIDVLQLTADGLGPDQIAQRLYLSPHTVKNHLRHAMAKLDAHTKLDAVVKAVRARLITIE